MQSRRRRRGSTMSVAQGQSLRGEANSSISAIRGSTIRPAIADRSEGGGMALRTRTAYVDCSRGLFSWIVYVNCLRELFTWMADAQPTPSGHAPAGKNNPVPGANATPHSDFSRDGFGICQATRPRFLSEPQFGGLTFSRTTHCGCDRPLTCVFFRGLNFGDLNLSRATELRFVKPLTCFL